MHCPYNWWHIRLYRSYCCCCFYNKCIIPVFLQTIYCCSLIIIPCVIMKRKFKQSIIPPISTRQTNTSHLNSLNIKKGGLWHMTFEIHKQKNIFSFLSNNRMKKRQVNLNEFFNLIYRMLNIEHGQDKS